MSLSGSLNAALSGLRAQSNKLGMVSDNIINANTIGYKRSSASFTTVVTTSTNARKEAGGVSVKPNLSMTQGTLTPGEPDNLAIQGDGFFVVTDDISTTNTAALSRNSVYTRDGSFEFDKDGNLVNENGFYLLGYRTNSTGAIPERTAVVINKEEASIPPVATENVTFYSNLPSNTLGVIDAEFLASTFNPQAVIDDESGAIYSEQTRNGIFKRNIDVNDSLGGEHTLNMYWTKLPESLSTGAGALFDDGSTLSQNNPNKWILSVDAESDFTNNLGVNVPAQFGVEFDPDTGAIREVYQADQNIFSGVSTTITIPAAEIATASGTAPAPNTLIIDDNSGILSADGTFGTALQSLGFPASVVGAEFTFSGFGDTGVDGTRTVVAGTVSGGNHVFELSPTVTGNLTTTNNVTLTITVPPTAANFSAIGTASLPISLEYSGDYLPGTFNTSTASSQQDISLNIGFIGSTDEGTVQWDDLDYNVRALSDDGEAYAEVETVSIDAEGFVNVTFSNGVVQPIYRIALAEFPNPNGLQNSTANTFIETIESGEPFLRDPGDGVGLLNVGSLEQSNVEISDEFGDLIVAQRAFSSNARVITTTDELLEEATNLIR